jgi:hypothetical protein
MYQKLYFGQALENHWNIIDILDENHRSTNLIAVRSEIRDRQTEACLQKLIHLRRKKIIGLSSYQEFPQKISNPHDGSIYNNQRFIEKYSDHIVLWCHCFRDPENYIPNNIPRILYSETDQYRHCLHLNASELQAEPAKLCGNICKFLSEFPFVSQKYQPSKQLT